MTEKDGAATHPILPFLMVFGGCISSIVFMEYVLKGDQNAGNLINATEFVFVLLQSIPGRLEPGSWTRFQPVHASWMSHAQHAFLWVSMSTLANYVFAFNIRIPIHTLFRSCNVIASVVIGWLFFQQRYTLKQVACVLILTVGIFLASIGDASKFWSSGTCVDCGTATPAPEMTSKELGVWSMGIALLVLTQMFQATLCHTQASFYKRFADKASKDVLADEYLFTSHVVSLVMILALWEDISSSAKLAVATPPLVWWLPIPTRIVWMILNNFTQLCCIKGVFRLAANYSPLTVTVTLSVRKFLSVTFSAAWFGNPWTNLHSAATLLIFGGVFAYSQLPAPPPSPPPEKKSE